MMFHIFQGSVERTLDLLPSNFGVAGLLELLISAFNIVGEYSLIPSSLAPNRFPPCQCIEYIRMCQIWVCRYVSHLGANQNPLTKVFCLDESFPRYFLVAVVLRYHIPLFCKRVLTIITSGAGFCKPADVCICIRPYIISRPDL